MMIIALTLFAALALLGACAFLQQSRFGQAPKGEELTRIKQSSNYVDGAFQNQLPTPVLKEGESTLSIIFKSMLNPVQQLRPSQALPTAKTDLTTLNPNDDLVIWLGHSSFYIQLAGKRILLDPVLSGYASPISFAVKAFAGTNLYTVNELPPIDLLLISHDHWDHLDYDTIKALEPKVKELFVPLGLGAHFQSWGYPKNKIHQGDWYDFRTLGSALTVHLVPARHYSGRGLSKNKSLWSGFVLESAEHRIYFSGDTGYGPHFKTIQQKFGAFDLVALDMGQYDPRWPYIHMTPAEAAQAARELETQALLPAHVGRFNLAQHNWREPFEQIENESQTMPYQLLTPLIGHPLKLEKLSQDQPRWWHQLTLGPQSIHEKVSES